MQRETTTNGTTIRWVGLAAVALLSIIAIVALLPNDEGATARHVATTSTDAAKAERAALEPPTLTTGDTIAAAAPVDATPPAEVAHTAAPIELTPDELRARLAAGEPGMEVLASRLAESSQEVAIAPRWQAGDEWLVETWYRQVQAHDAPWTGPALWRFRVERETRFEGVDCHEVVVTRADEPGVEPVMLWISRDRGALIGAETTVAQQGKAQRQRFTAEDATGAVRAPLTSAPVRLPPRDARAKVAPRGLPFDHASLSRELPEGFTPPSELVGAGGEYLDIEFNDPLDGTTVRQRWSSADLRWPVVSRTETTISVRRG
jgi:hypothetical protein